MSGRYCWLLVIILVGVSLPTASAQDMSGAIEQVRESVLTIKSGERVGAGFIVSPDGHGLTSAHLVGDSSQVTAVLANDEERDAKVTKTDEALDLPLGQQGAAAVKKPAAGPTKPIAPPVKQVGPSWLLLVAIPFTVALVVSLLVSLLVTRRVRRRPAEPEISLAPASEDEDLSDIDITLH